MSTSAASPPASRAGTTSRGWFTSRSLAMCATPSPGKSSSRVGSLTQDAVDRAKKPHMGGLGEYLVLGTSPFIMTHKSRPFAPATVRMTGSLAAPPFFTVAAWCCQPKDLLRGRLLLHCRLEQREVPAVSFGLQAVDRNKSQGR